MSVNKTTLAAAVAAVFLTASSSAEVSIDPSLPTPANLAHVSAGCMVDEAFPGETSVRRRIICDYLFGDQSVNKNTFELFYLPYPVRTINGTGDEVALSAWSLGSEGHQTHYLAALIGDEHLPSQQYICVGRVIIRSQQYGYVGSSLPTCFNAPTSDIQFGGKKGLKFIQGGDLQQSPHLYVVVPGQTSEDCGAVYSYDIANIPFLSPQQGVPYNPTWINPVARKVELPKGVCVGEKVPNGRTITSGGCQDVMITSRKLGSGEIAGVLQISLGEGEPEKVRYRPTVHAAFGACNPD